jgi:hypothetical protein
MQLVRESARAKKALHRNTTILHGGTIRAAAVKLEDNGNVSYTFTHNVNDTYGSRYTLELSSTDLTRLVNALGPR